MGLASTLFASKISAVKVEDVYFTADIEIQSKRNMEINGNFALSDLPAQAFAPVLSALVDLIPCAVPAI